MVSTEELSDEMYKLIKEYKGKKKFKPQDLLKEMEKKYGEIDRATGKRAIKELIDSGRCIYTYYGGTAIEIKED
jgi:hypothetical protein